MSNYQDLLAQKAALEKQTAELEKALQEARRAERAGVIAQIKSLLSEHGLTVADLGLKAGGKVAGTPSSSAGRKVAPSTATTPRVKPGPVAVCSPSGFKPPSPRARSWKTSPS